MDGGASEETAASVGGSSNASDAAVSDTARKADGARGAGRQAALGLLTRGGTREYGSNPLRKPREAGAPALRAAPLATVDEDVEMQGALDGDGVGLGSSIVALPAGSGAAHGARMRGIETGACVRGAGEHDDPCAADEGAEGDDDTPSCWRSSG